MAKSAVLNFPQNVNNNGLTFVPADTTTAKDLFTAGANDSKVTSIIAATDDTAIVNVKVLLHDGTAARLLGVTRVAVASGTDGATPSVDLINSTSIPGLPIDANGKRFIPLKTGQKIQIAPLVTVTAAKTLTVTAIGEDF